MAITLDKERSALLVVDVQLDFLPGGALPVGGGDEIVSPIADLMEAGLFELIVAAQDWHPPEHVSFASNHPGRRAFDRIELYGHEQILWPDHCVQGTAGANLHPGIPWARAVTIRGPHSVPPCIVAIQRGGKGRSRARRTWGKISAAASAGTGARLGTPVTFGASPAARIPQRFWWC